MSGRPTRLLGVVLCGGNSRRMGVNKALLPHPAGGTYLRHSVDRLDEVCDAVVVSGRSATIDGVVNLPDEAPGLGPAGGIASALRWAAADCYSACVLTPVDVPFLTALSLERMARSWRRGSGEIVCAGRAGTDFIEPLIAVLPVAFVESASRLASSRDRSVHRWIVREGYRRVDLPPRQLVNMNSPVDVRGHCPGSGQ